MNVRASTRSRLIAALVTVGATAIAVGFVEAGAAPSATAQSIRPGATAASAMPPATGVHDCEVGGRAWLKVQPRAGVYHGAQGFTVKLEGRGAGGGGWTFDFAATGGAVHAVVVDEGSAARKVYSYAKGVARGKGLGAVSGTRDKAHRIKDILLCYRPCPQTRPSLPALPKLPKVPALPKLPPVPTIAPPATSHPTVPPSVPPSHPTAPATMQPASGSPEGTAKSTGSGGTDTAAPQGPARTAGVPTAVNAGGSGELRLAADQDTGAGNWMTIGLLGLGTALLVTGGAVLRRRRRVS